MKKQLQQFLWITPFLTFSLGYLVLAYSFASKTIKTPHFIGSSLHQAMTHAADKNLRLHIITEREHTQIEPGTILEQKPQPGSSIKEKQSVYIITARKPEEKNTPNILGRTPDEIGTVSEQERIKPKRYTIPSTHNYDTCIAQIPAPNKPLKDNKVIAYMAQEKSPFFILPDLTGLPLENVIEFLQEYPVDYSVYYRTNKLTPPYPEDAVIRNQKPLIGSFIKLDRSTHIQLQVE